MIPTAALIPLLLVIQASAMAIPRANQEIGVSNFSYLHPSTFADGLSF